MGDSNFYNMQYGNPNMARSFSMSGNTNMSDIGRYQNEFQGGHFMRGTPPPNFHQPQQQDELASSMAALTFTSTPAPVQSAAMNFFHFYQQGGFNISAHEFVPKSGVGSRLHSSASAPSFEQFPAAMSKVFQSSYDANSPSLTPSGSPLSRRRNQSPVPQLDIVAASGQGHLDLSAQAQADLVQENVGGTTYFFNKDEYVSPLTRQSQRSRLDYSYRVRKLIDKAYPNYSMYASVPPHIAHMRPGRNNPSFFMDNEIKMDLLNKQATVLSVVEGITDVPEQVDNYCRLVPLELAPVNPHSQFGYPSTAYKAVNQRDGITYCLRRIHGYKVTNTKCMQVIETWKKMKHANIVTLREVFTTKSFGDNSIVFVYDYHPKAETLAARHFNNPHVHNGYSSPYNLDGGARPYSAGKKTGKPGSSGLLAESTIWSYIIQISSALRSIHSVPLACHSLDPTKILLTDKARLRLNCCGVYDVLTFDPAINSANLVQQYHKKDLRSFGTILLGLACNSIVAVHREHLKASMELISRNYSQDLLNVIMFLLNPSQQQQQNGVNAIMPMVGARFYAQVDSLSTQCDTLENELSKACESDRLFRLLTKLNTVLERSEFSMDPSWAETGDRYLLTLFRDYVFHQTDEHGAPWLDMSHIVACLNKLDAGVSEKVCLSSRDENSVIIVSYTELKRCFEAAFSELVQASVGTLQ